MAPLFKYHKWDPKPPGPKIDASFFHLIDSDGMMLSKRGHLVPAPRIPKKDRARLQLLFPRLYPPGCDFRPRGNHVWSWRRGEEGKDEGKEVIEEGRREEDERVGDGEGDEKVEERVEEKRVLANVQGCLIHRLDEIETLTELQREMLAGCHGGMDCPFHASLEQLLGTSIASSSSREDVILGGAGPAEEEKLIDAPEPEHLGGFGKSGKDEKSLLD